MSRWLTLTLALGLAAGCGADTNDSDAGDGAPAAATAAEATGANGAGTAEAGPATEAGQEVVYVDVRTPEEFATGHVEGAINIPHTEMPQRWNELEPYRGDEMVVYCRSGRRSGIAIETLKEAGFTNLENGGGLSDLAAEGVPVVR